MNKHTDASKSPIRVENNNNDILSPGRDSVGGGSPDKGQQKRNKYAGVPSKISSGIVTKPPIPDFAANRVKREAEQKKADSVAPTMYTNLLVKQHYRRFA